ncbi:MAG: hypothetical protein ACRDBY_01080 [Cetobacterium sp.]
MNKKELFELMEWQVLEIEDLKEIQLIPDIEVEFNGLSGRSIDLHWYTAVDNETGKEFNFYINFKMEV